MTAITLPTPAANATTGAGNGNDSILDYVEDDTIQIASGTIKSGKNVIFTADKNKISVVAGASKALTYIDADGNINCYPIPPASSVVLEDSGATCYQSGLSLFPITATRLKR